MNKELLIVLLLLFDVVILVFLIFLYVKFKKLLNLPIDELEESLERAHQLVNKLKEIKKKEETSSPVTFSNPKEEVFKLYQRGLKIKEIAKQTGLTEGEVELLLKTKKLI
ncbi:MAG: DUF6115 domain-containing protein [Caldimicrobium sp.]